MLNQQRSGNLARLKYLMVLPIFSGLLCISTLALSKTYGWVDLAPAKAIKSISAIKKKLLKVSQSGITTITSQLSVNQKEKEVNVTNQLPTNNENDDILERIEQHEALLKQMVEVDTHGSVVINVVTNLIEMFNQEILSLEVEAKSSKGTKLWKNEMARKKLSDITDKALEMVVPLLERDAINRVLRAQSPDELTPVMISRAIEQAEAILTFCGQPLPPALQRVRNDQTRQLNALL